MKKIALFIFLLLVLCIYSNEYHIKTPDLFYTPNDDFNPHNGELIKAK